ncbi:hypothetical protein C4K22_5999 [Pseudomonas chlororaphis subsp. aurantiaca]|nr:hypothetical protein C4K22_5999 [Pseudomonas chlororaphis subsp. aurantiaca]AZD45038.1 hypothetical protein C4K21_6009 [Pseudomonas chlororaphis subsp. aurantiaca]
MYTVQKMQRLHRHNRGQSSVDRPLLQTTGAPKNSFNVAERVPT